MISPPSFPDAVHVANGCFISTFNYLTRYTAAYPTERGECAAVLLPNVDGSLRPHSLAVISWHGRWWVRDEYYGVFQLEASARAPWLDQQLIQRVEAVLPQRAARAGDVERRWAEQQSVKHLTGESALAWRLDQLAQARRLLPMPSEIRWCQTSAGEQPFLFFRMQGDDFGVYDPTIGTATAASLEHDADKLVAAVARRMGYVPFTVRVATSQEQSVTAGFEPAAREGRRCAPEIQAKQSPA